MRRFCHVFILFIFIFIIINCEDDKERVNTVGACEQMATAVADASVRCEGSEHQAAYDVYLDAAVGGSCDNVRGVRDTNMLLDECIPSFETITCSNYLAGDLPSSCLKQLIVDKE